MKAEESILRQPDFIPAKWLYVLGVASISLVGAALSIGIWIQSIDSRVSASEKEIRDTTLVRMQLIERLNSIDQRLSHIEGQLSK